MNLKLVIAIYLIIFGVLVSFLPVASYYFTTYIHFSHYSVEKGSRFIYFVKYTILAGAKTDQLGYLQPSIHMLVNITVLGHGKVLLQVSFPQSYLNYTSKIVPAKYMKYFKPYAQVVNITSPAVQYFIINDTKGGPPKTFPQPIVGLPYTVVYGNSSVGMWGYYAEAASGKYSYNFYPQLLPTNYNFSFLKAVDPPLEKGYNGSFGDSVLNITLLYTNTAPKEDWSYYLEWSVFLLAYPINFILILAGIIVLIIYWRKR